jgi:hypothetical protein
MFEILFRSHEMTLIQTWILIKLLTFDRSRLVGPATDPASPLRAIRAAPGRIRDGAV